MRTYTKPYFPHLENGENNTTRSDTIFFPAQTDNLNGNKVNKNRQKKKRNGEERH